jgi:Peptidase C10 family.
MPSRFQNKKLFEKARAFMPGKQFESVNSARSLKNAKSKRIAAEHLYIFNVENKDGFVIVSGDERTEPILAYSDKGHVDANNLPDNLRSWLEGL